MGVPDEDGHEEQDGGRKASGPDRDALSGTTRKVYRYIYKHGPVRPHDIQRDLGLSSSSVSDYHVQKLLRMRLIREQAGQDGVPGFVTEEAVFEAMLRVRRTIIPLWTTASAFFGASVFVLGVLLRPQVITSSYLFSLVVAAVAFSICAYEAFESLTGGGVP